MGFLFVVGLCLVPFLLFLVCLLFSDGIVQLKGLLPVLPQFTFAANRRKDG